MAETVISDSYKVIYLLVEVGSNGNKRTLWRPAGRAYPCRDGSLNIKLDIHPGLVFNCRDPKSKAEQEEAEADAEEDDRSFTCALCKTANPNEHAHAVYDGTAVCDDCFAGHYRECGRCDYAYPKIIKGTHCPNCRGGGKR